MRCAAAMLVLLVPLAQSASADQTTSAAELVAILHAIHADRCGVGGWRGPVSPVVISDRPSPAHINEITKRPFKMYGIELWPRAPAGTLWPRVTLCPGVGVVDHVRLERVVNYESHADNASDVLALAFGASSFEEISLPAFSADGNRAVVYRAHECLLCGEGIYFELKRTPHGWRVTRREQAWAT